MNPIQKDELYDNISQFLKNKGIDLKEGSYTKGIHAGCSLLADAINLSQTGLERAKTGIEKKFDKVRQVIHEKTAPKPPVSATPPPPPPNGKQRSTTVPPRAVRAKAKTGGPRSKGKGRKSK
jgi:hypothetical protein